MSEWISRLAPTPSGFLHLGNACNFVLCWAIIRSKRGRLRLRIDDLDAQRLRPEYLDDIFFTLDWLGLDWDDGPTSVGEHQHMFSQQLRIPLYKQVVQQLWESGLAFGCRCSRKEIAANSLDGQYPGSCRSLGLASDAEGTATRIKIPEGHRISWNDQLSGAVDVSLYQRMRDFVINRKDGLPAYQIASLVDDLAFGTNLIVRGEDLMDSTAAQLFLARQLNASAFLQIQWHHHPLLLTSAGHKLSKSKGAMAVRTYRQNKQSSALVYRQVGQWLGLSPVESPSQLLEQLTDNKRFS
ncbi:MAG: glutamate--tRNA ligase family protein [Bacteroidota bacterium]